MSRNNQTFEYMEAHFEEVEPLDFYRELFGNHLSAGPDDGQYPLNGIIHYQEEKSGKWKSKRVWNDLEAIREMQGAYNAAVSPIAYLGPFGKAERARWIFSLTIDLDNILPDHGMGSLWSQIERAEVLPRPTYIACSGEGLHVYYFLDEPIPCFEYNRKRLKKLKNGLTRLLWNGYITENPDKPEYETFVQDYRIVGSQCKPENQEKPGDAVKVYLTGERVTVDYLNSFVPKESRARIGGDGIPLEIKYGAEWYEERLIKKNPRKYWKVSRAVYDWWKDQIKKGASVHHRYYTIMSLAIYAQKCGISYAELEKDAYSFLPMLEGLTEDEDNHFTEHDIKSALRAYQPSYRTFPRDWIAESTAIEIRANKRNGYTREESLLLAREKKKVLKSIGRLKKEGRHSKEDIVKAWREKHPEGRKADCIKETGLSKMTVYKHWGEKKKEEGPFSSYEELVSYMRSLNREELEAFYELNKKAIQTMMGEN